MNVNPDYDKQLEGEISRELKGLPELFAPATLVSRVMAAIEERPAMPWYRQPWPAWPAALQVSSLVILLALFGGLCFGGWKLSQAESLAAAARAVGDSFSELGVIWNALTTLAGAVVLIVKQLGTGFMIACLFMAICAYASCVGLGTMVVRYARCGVRRT